MIQGEFSYSPPRRDPQNRRFLDFDKSSQQQQRTHYDTDLLAVVTTLMVPPHPTRVVDPISTNPRDHPGVETNRSDPLLPFRSQYQDSAMGSNNNPSENHPSDAIMHPPNPTRVVDPIPTHLMDLPGLEPNASNPSTLQEAINSAFHGWHGKTARPWQVGACEQLLHRHVHPLPSVPLRPMLLVRSTGGGKSAVRDVCGILTGGITITIVPLLSLSADQTSKLVTLSSSQGLDRHLKVFNLDVLRSKTINDFLRSKLESLSSDSRIRVTLFTSPQKLTKDTSWQKTLQTCFRRGSIRFIAVDECHLYASHGLEFRQEFGDLKEILFNMAKRNTTIPIPILFMTATASDEMVNDVELLTGLTFDKTNDFMWPHHHSGVHRRNIFISFVFQDSPLRHIKRELIKTSRTADGRKLMVYSNSRKAIINLYGNCRNELNIKRIEKDLVLVHGNMYREQKFHNTDLFVGKPLVEQCPTTGRTLRFDPVGYFATAGATSSGIDCHEVDQVLFHGFPQSTEDFLQCSGRCGRSPTATYKTSRFTILASLNSMVSLLTRIFIIPKYEASKAAATNEANANSTDTTAPTTALLSQEALSKRQWERARCVMSLLCIDDGRCVHFALEQLMLNPNKSSICDLHTSCGGACWRCATPRISTPLDAPINVQTFKKYLLRMFITEKLPPSKLLLHNDVFLNEMLAFDTPGPDGKTVKCFPKAVLGITSKASVRQRSIQIVHIIFRDEYSNRFLSTEMHEFVELVH